MKTAKMPKRETVTKSGKFSPQEKFGMMRDDMNEALIERDAEIDLALTAMLCKEHLLLVGPPGTAKSLLAHSIAQWVQTEAFTVHLCKDTSREAAFGPLKISKLAEDVYDRILEGGAAAAKVLVLEEVFKAGPAVLDMFLLLLNERIYREGLVKHDCPLEFALGLSNEWQPEGAEASTAAFFDRFVFRKHVRYISKAGRNRLMWNGSHLPQFTSRITDSEIAKAQEEAMELEIDKDVQHTFEEIIEELNKEGIVPGDRRMFKSINATKAYAYLCGSDTVEREHLDILSHVLWVEPTEQPDKCAKIVGKIANPLGAKVIDMIQMAEDVIRSSTSNAECIAKLKSIREELKLMGETPKRKMAISYVSSEIKRLYNSEIGVEND